MVIDAPLQDESPVQMILIDLNVSFNGPNANKFILPHENIESHKTPVIDVWMIKSDKKHDTELLQIIAHDVVLS